jgi:hypothetical protein
MVNLMFIRFVSGEINGASHMAAGLFCAAFDLIYDGDIPDYDYAELAELMDWFNLYLKGPFEYRLRKFWRAQRSICWFKSDACEYVQRAWLMMNVLERNDVFMRMIKSRTVGCVIYEDEAQVLAYPSADLRRML